MDMRDDVFADCSFGVVARRKIGPSDPNFRLYEAGWLGKGSNNEVMQVTGAVFREATCGKNKGRLIIMLRETRKTVYVTAQEMKDEEEAMRTARTDWFPPETKPKHTGVYETRRVDDGRTSRVFYSMWDGKVWKSDDSSADSAAHNSRASPTQNREWRGLEYKPKPAHGKEEVL